MHKNGFMSNPSKYGSKGGKKKGAVKGFAYMQKHNPEKFKQIVKDTHEKPKAM